ncbi:MAG: SprB repeat-containing protein, partial [Bacteroidota bacterium]
MLKTIHSLGSRQLFLGVFLLLSSLTLSAQLTVSLDGEDPLCFGLASGSVTATVSGGTIPYTYNWSNGEETPFITNLTAGIYLVTVTDALGASGESSITLTEPSLVTIDLSADQNCSAPFTLNANGNGGVGDYSYNWSTGASTSTIVVSDEAQYCVTVVDGNGCGTFECIDVMINSPEVEVVAIDVTCFGDMNGSLTATATDGSPPYSYSWSNGGSGATIDNLGAGTYGVTVTDANGCMASTTGTVNEPPELTTTTQSLHDVCPGEATGSVMVLPVGGTPPYTYLWSTGATTQGEATLPAGIYSVTVTDANGCTAVDETEVLALPGPDVSIEGDPVICGVGNTTDLTATASGGTGNYQYEWNTGALVPTINVGPGTYSVTVTDGNGCTDEASIEVTLIDISISLTSTDVVCNGDANGTATVTVTGGDMPYTYEWSNGATTPTITDLAPGTYTVEVEEANGCKALGMVTISEPPAISIVGEVTDVLCFGLATGSIDIFAVGGTAPYTYDWDDLVGSDDPQDRNGLAAGTYTVTVTDANNCTATETYTITEPTQLIVTGEVTDVLCNGDANGAIDLTVSGGTAPYVYSWSTGATTQDLSGLEAGTYAVTVVDDNGCGRTEEYTVNEPPPLEINATTTDVLCNGDETGAIDLTVSGGTPPYSYSWSSGDTTEDLADLPAGDYTGTVTDANGCTISATLTINEPPALMVSAVVTDVLCNGDATGAIDLTVTGGVQPYSFSWGNGATTEDLSDLAAGDYTGTVTDANGCTISATLTVTEPPALMVSAQVTDVLCNGDETGAIDLTVSGGTPPYSYSWSNGATTQDLSDLAAGDYTGTVTDANGCTISATLTVAEPTALMISATTMDVLCNGDATGSIDLTVSGGTPPYSYNWSNGATTQDLSDLAAGDYTGTVTDANGCTISATVTINEPPALMVSAVVTDVLCNGDETGAIDLTVTGGVQPYSFSWSNGATTEDLSDLAAGDYTGTVTDANGCTISATLTVAEPAALMVSAQVTDVLCNGD